MTRWYRMSAPEAPAVGRSTGRSAGRSAGAAATALLTLGGGLLMGATPASAAITGFPAAPYTSNTTIAIQASVAQSATQSTLLLADPSGASKQVAAATSQDVLGRYDATTLSYALVTTCEQASTTSCSGDHPALNGTWVVKVVGDSANTDTKQFRVDIAPRIPAGVVASATGPSQITVTWQPNTEPDLQQYDVLDGAGHSLRTVTAGSCGSGTCSTTFDYPSTASGARSFAVSATRSAPVESSGSLSSPASSSQQAVLAPASGSPSTAPRPSPSSTPTAGTSGGGAATGPGQTGTGTGPASPAAPTAATGDGAGTASNGAVPARADNGPVAAAAAVAARTAFAESFSSFEPRIGLNKLPPLPVNQAPTPAVGSLPDGAYQPTLGYTDQVVREPVPGTRTAARVSSALTGGLAGPQLAKILAITLLLVLGGLHLRRLAVTGARS